MNYKLNESTIAECQAQFNLTYHVSYAYTCQKLLGFEGKDVLEVGGSLPKEFVLEYLNVNSWTGLETPDYETDLKEVGGITHQGTVISKINSTEQYKFNSSKSLGKYNFFLENIEELPSQYYKKYDLVFSIAAFEHIQKFPAALEKMYLALKPSGKLFSMFSPIWSAHDGHHLPKITDQQGNNFSFGNSPIPPWGHLRMSPPAMCKHLYQFTDKATADLMVYYIYNSPFINRFFTEDYIEFINQSSFQVSQLNLTFQSQIEHKIQKELEERHQGKQRFANNGILAVLEKPLQEKNNRQLSVKTSQNQTQSEIRNNSVMPSQNQALKNLQEAQTATLPSQPNILFFALGNRETYRPAIFSKNEVFASPDCKLTQEGETIKTIGTPVGRFNIETVIENLPSEQQPDLLVVKADATGRLFPENLQVLNCPKILLCGNTQHLNFPIQTLLEYAIQEEFNFVMSDHKRHHLHYFREAGFRNLLWIPGFNVNPHPQETQNNFENSISFIGQVGRFHPYRRYIIKHLQKLGLPLNCQTASQEKAAEIYANSLINLNISLNGDLNLRIFEVLSSGGFLLTDYLSPQSGLDLLFEENQHLCTFKDEFELQHKLEFFLAHPEQTQEIAQKGCEVFWEKYSPKHQIERIFNYLEGNGVEQTFLIESEPRSSYVCSENREELKKRIGIYEFIQQRHLECPYLKGLVGQQVNPNLIADIVDLPRLKVYRLHDYHQSDPQLNELLYQCQLDEQINFISFQQLDKEQLDWKFVVFDLTEIQQMGLDVLLSKLDFAWLILTDQIDTLTRYELENLEARLQTRGFVRKSNFPLAWKWENQATWGQILLDHQQWYLATQVFKKILQKNPCNVTSLVELGKISYKLGNLNEAERLFYTALTLDRRNPLILEALSDIYLKLNDALKASRMIKTLILMNPNNSRLLAKLELVDQYN